MTNRREFLASLAAVLALPSPDALGPGFIVRGPMEADWGYSVIYTIAQGDWRGAVRLPADADAATRAQALRKLFAHAEDQTRGVTGGTTGGIISPT